MSSIYNAVPQQFYGAPQIPMMNTSAIATGVPMGMVSGVLAPQMAMGIPLSQFSVPQQSITNTPNKGSPLVSGSVAQGWNAVFPATVPSSGMAVSQGSVQAMGVWSLQKPASPVVASQMQPNAMLGAWGGMPYGAAQGIPAYQQTSLVKPQPPASPYAVQGVHNPNLQSVHKPNPAAMPASAAGAGAPGAVGRRVYKNGEIVPLGQKSKKSGADDVALAAGGLAVLALAAALIFPPALLALPVAAAVAAC